MTGAAEVPTIGSEVETMSVGPVSLAVRVSVAAWPLLG